ncbi:MAG: energy transducer TonB [Magnetococcales bacterium]|nr:energy transducer TonB [Magnetococcales bacterium]MBF0156357.1 energy transducer TonB [Magnetococcales bacterium]
MSLRRSLFRGSFSIHLFLSILLHGVLFGLVVAELRRAASPEGGLGRAIQVELVSLPGEERPPPEAIQALAEVNHRADPKARMAKPGAKFPEAEVGGAAPPAAARPLAPGTVAGAISPMTAGDPRMEKPLAATPAVFPGEGESLGVFHLDSRLSPPKAQVGPTPGEGTESSPGIPEAGDVTTRQALHAEYVQTLKEKVRPHWRYPPEARRRGLVGVVSVALTLGADGALIEARVDRSSGAPLLDEAALKALREAAPFPPLPTGWGLERFSLQTSFEYSRRERAGSGRVDGVGGKPR